MLPDDMKKWRADSFSLLSPEQAAWGIAFILAACLLVDLVERIVR